MPNHITGKLVIFGRKGDLEQIRKYVASDERIIDAENIIPYPEEYQRMDEKVRERYGEWNNQTKEQVQNYENDFKDGTVLRDGYNSGGYDWCWDNWGTKWNFYHISGGEITEPSDGDILSYCTLEYGFRTAWNPPTPLIEALSKKFPANVMVLYFEDEGWCFDAGYQVFQDGQISERTFDSKSWKLEVEQNWLTGGFAEYDLEDKEEDLE